MSKGHDARGWNASTRKYWKARIEASLPQPCARCGVDIQPGSTYDIDHIVSLSQGGLTEADNLSAAHVRCNRSHGGRIGRAKQLGRINEQRDERGDPEW